LPSWIKPGKVYYFSELTRNFRRSMPASPHFSQRRLI
jgi:hypothetical protein